MSENRHLLYLFPDVAYVAEVAPGKKAHTFTVQNFRQISGEFMKEEIIVGEAVQKLADKIAGQSLSLVLPDSLFANTIIEIKETAEGKVKTYLKEVLLPRLNLSKDTHQIETFVLTQYNQTTNIQLTALENEVLDPLITAFKAHNVKITEVLPLSWTLKSIISLEPSISISQLGSRLYVAEHYIGVDQCIDAGIDEVENVGETIKTLKGAQPSIQTIYVISNQLIEDRLKELVSDSLPIQQLATFREDDAKLPSYIKFLIESTAKTLSISDYPVPSFSLPEKPVGSAVAAVTTETPPATKPIKVDLDDDELETASETEEEEVEEELPLPKPIVQPASLPAPTTAVDAEEDEESSDDDEDGLEEVDDPELDTPAMAGTTPVAPVSFPDVPAGGVVATTTITDITDVTETTSFTARPVQAESDTDDIVLPASLTGKKDSPTEAGDDSEEDSDEEAIAVTTTTSSTQVNTEAATIAPPPKKIIKNPAGNQTGKMILMTLGAFLITVALGVGIGFGLLSYLNQRSEVASPLASASPLPSVEPETSPSPSPSPLPEINKEDIDVLVVNATTIAGHAGQVRRTLDEAGYGTVTAGNARGQYEPGVYLLLPAENASLAAALTADTKLNLTVQTGSSTEDPRNQYSAVVVLAE